MDHHTKKTKLSPRVRHHVGIILTGFAALFIAAFIVTLLTSKSSHQPRPTITKSAPTAVVRITKDGFQPATISVRPGTKVTWINMDSALHQVAANPFPDDTDLPGLKSVILNNDQTYTYVASQTGSFGYHDQLAPTTNGTLIVGKR